MYVLGARRVRAAALFYPMYVSYTGDGCGHRYMYDARVVAIYVHIYNSHSA